MIKINSKNLDKLANCHYQNIEEYINQKSIKYNLDDIKNINKKLY